MADPAVARFLGDGSPMSRDDAWRQMAVHAGAWSLRGFSHWALELRATGELIGRAGPWYPEGWPDLEIGWVIHPRHQGRGYATEAGREALACAWGLGRGRVISLIRPQNLASAAVARKLGAVLDTRIEHFFGAPADVWAYPPPG